jgi:ABC-type multidrug transport system ATPase subunit
MHLSIRELSKTYPNSVKALDQVTLEIGPGMFGLLGPNGAGKTTLMNTLATLQSADAGRVYFGDMDVLKEPHKLRPHLGYLPQEFGVYPRTSAQVMLGYFAQLKGLSEAHSRRSHVLHLLELVNLTDERARDVDTFSGGMRQRFGIAQALIGSPKLVIVDEPTAGLDPAERNRFHNILSEIGENTVVLLSTHIVEDVANLCSQMAILHGGRIVAQGKPEELKAALRGQVWETATDKSHAHALRTAWRSDGTPSVRHLSSRLTGGRMLVTVAAATSPGPEFRPKAPDLEDVYFSFVPQEAEE